MAGPTPYRRDSRSSRADGSLYRLAYRVPAVDHVADERSYHQFRSSSGGQDWTGNADEHPILAGCPSRLSAMGKILLFVGRW
jgi:hypothetical protein